MNSRSTKPAAEYISINASLQLQQQEVICQSPSSMFTFEKLALSQNTKPFATHVMKMPAPSSFKLDSFKRISKLKGTYILDWHVYTHTSSTINYELRIIFTANKLTEMESVPAVC